MTRTTDIKHRLALGTFKNASVAVMLTSLLSCGGGGGTNVASGTASTSDAVPIEQAPTPPPAGTAAALNTFWGRYGAKDSFTPMYVEVITKLLEAEDKVFAKDYQGARRILDPLIAKYPLINDSDESYYVWARNFDSVQKRNPRPHLGEPGPYAHLRMLDDITNFATKNSLPGTTPIQMAIVMPVCSDIVTKSGVTSKNERLSPEIEANSYEVVRQSLRLFQSYLLAMSKGELRLELNFYKVDKCFQINKDTNYAIGDYNAPIRQLPPGVIEKTDMFWMIYPSDYDKGIVDIVGGMGGLSGKPVFISEDDWILKKRPDQGGGPRTEVERRMYLPEWVQHEFFHHMFASWPEFKLEGAKNHEWFDRNYWQKDFVGKNRRRLLLGVTSQALVSRHHNPKHRAKAKTSHSIAGATAGAIAGAIEGAIANQQDRVAALAPSH